MNGNEARPESRLTVPAERGATLKDVVQTRLREAILSGEITSSSRITESQLASNLKISRAPVREALKQMEVEGLIVSSGYRGYSVRGAQMEDLRELFQLRMALERLAISLAVDHLDANNLRDLNSIVDQMDQVERNRIQRRENSLRADLDTRFHEHLCRLAKHEMLLKVWSSMRDQIRFALVAVDLSYPPAAIGFAQNHRVILDSLAQKDKKAAEAAIEQHIMGGLERLISTAKQRASVKKMPDRRPTSAAS